MMQNMCIFQGSFQTISLFDNIMAQEQQPKVVGKYYTVNMYHLITIQKYLHQH